MADQGFRAVSCFFFFSGLWMFLTMWKKLFFQIFFCTRLCRTFSISRIFFIIFWIFLFFAKIVMADHGCELFFFFSGLWMFLTVWKKLFFQFFFCTRLCRTFSISRIFFRILWIYLFLAKIVVAVSYFFLSRLWMLFCDVKKIQFFFSTSCKHFSISKKKIQFFFKLFFCFAKILKAVSCFLIFSRL